MFDQIQRLLSQVLHCPACLTRFPSPTQVGQNRPVPMVILSCESDAMVLVKIGRALTLLDQDQGTLFQPRGLFKHEPN